MSIIEKFGIVVIIVAIICAGSWITNLVKFATSDFKPTYKEEIVRGVGVVVPPVGVIVGFMDLGSENSK